MSCDFIKLDVNKFAQVEFQWLFISSAKNVVRNKAKTSSEPLFKTDAEPVYIYCFNYKSDF